MNPRFPIPGELSIAYCRSWSGSFVGLCLVAGLLFFRPAVAAEESSPADSSVPVFNQTNTDVIKPPVRLQPFAPVYPPESVRRGEEGETKLRVLVDKDGTPQAIEVAVSSGYSRLDEAAKVAAAKTRFGPALKSGEPIASYLIIPVAFEIEKPLSTRIVYKTSEVNRMITQKRLTTPIRFSDFTTSVDLNTKCRLSGVTLYSARAGLLDRFSMEAFNAELTSAGRFAQTASPIRAVVTRLEMSTVFTGFWDMEISLVGNNGRTLQTSARVEFPITLNTAQSCKAAAERLPDLVKLLYYQVMSSEEFIALVDPADSN